MGESEAEKQELINHAQGKAEEIVAAAKARVQSIQLISEQLAEDDGKNAAAFAGAEKYITAFGELAKTNNTLILPANAGDMGSMAAQAMAIYNQLRIKK